VRQLALIVMVSPSLSANDFKQFDYLDHTGIELMAAPLTM